MNAPQEIKSDSSPPSPSSIVRKAWYRRQAWRWLLSLALLAAICGGVAYHQREPILAAAGQWLNIAEPLREPVDYLFILGGDSDTRPFAAAAIVKSGLARQVLLARTPQDDGSLSLPHHELLRQVLLQRGVPVDAILELPREVASTGDEASALQDFLSLHPGKSVAVITNDYHTRRARMLFRRHLGAKMAQVLVIGTPTERFKSSNWWHYEQGVKIYLNEYIKMVYDFF